VLSEYIIKGNAAIIKCNIPSFVTDFVKVEAWIGSENNELFTYQTPNETDYGKFEMRITKERQLDESVG
jgi:hypothetical protein